MGEIKRALVLSGGGARGAFQYGALKYIYETFEGEEKPYFNTIAGVSVGALNGAMLVQDEFDTLGRIWNSLTDEQIYRGRMTVLHALWRIIRGKKSVLSNAPLFELMKKHIFLNKVSTKFSFRFGAVSLLTGEYSLFTPEDFENSQAYRKAILSSTAIPILWEPVQKFRIRNGAERKDMVDGGIRNYSPLGDVLDTNPDQVIIINCNTMDLPRDPDADNNLFTIAKRSLAEITLNENFRADINEFIQINRLVKQAEEQGVSLKRPDGTEYDYYKDTIIQPDEYPGDTLDFSQDNIQLQVERGYNKAKEIMTAN